MADATSLTKCIVLQSVDNQFFELKTNCAALSNVVAHAVEKGPQAKKTACGFFT